MYRRNILLFLYCYFINLPLSTKFPEENLRTNLPASVEFDSTRGRQLLQSKNTELKSFFSLIENFETQQTQAFCGIASLTIALNSLYLPQDRIANLVDPDPLFFPYELFTQDNIFNTNCIKKGVFNISDTDVFIFKGASLFQLHEAISCFSVDVTSQVHLFQDDKNAEEFAAKLFHSFILGKRIIANINRLGLYGAGGGHFSPIAAVSKKPGEKFTSAWVLFLDVSRYKYKPKWFKLGDLVEAMREKEEDGKSRGFLSVSAVNS
eukprot:snap_masked-scaffold_2-processed-gene-12.35-mRNA-1 protein AED:1.00 eAED:1.00 QI:0/0/0/0/1/1/2/0/263